MRRFLVEYLPIGIDDYRRLREESGLSPKSEAAAAIGLKNTLCSVVIRDVEDQMKTVGMGRLVGDGACHCQVVDICVLPEFQGNGLGKEVMNKLKDYIDMELPASCYISLIADGEAYKLYEQFGFTAVWPTSRGMGLKK